MLADLFGASRMSGSGSAVFASAGSNPDTEWLQENLRRLLATMPQGWQARLCRGLEYHPLLDWTND
jgi:4-diphosphocytidyl-2-C-methyl-D-erythritol kinase